jgi:hypothetical protein
MGGFDLTCALGIDQGCRSAGTRQQDTAFLECFADRGDPKTQGSRIKPLAAGIEFGAGDDVLVALVDTAAGKHQRARVKIDLIMAHHHEDLDFALGAVAQQKDGGCGARCDGFGGHSQSTPDVSSWFETAQKAPPHHEGLSS